MATNWTDPSVSSSTHIRATHINELRSVVDKNRLVAGLGGYSWADSPVTPFTRIRATHFTQLQSAIQGLWTSAGMGTLPNWSYGSAPAGSGRHISARDVTDLRTWVQDYQNTKGPSYDPNYWGVDSCAPANSTVGSLTLFQWVVQNAGVVPAFWGRYIGATCSLTASEVSFLHGNNCKLLLIYGDTTAPGVEGPYQNGVNDATSAIADAQVLHVPANTAIFADIEAEWTPTQAWIEGWSDTMLNSIYAGGGGLYAATNGSAFNIPYCAAYSSDETFRLNLSLLYASEPETGCTVAGEAPAFAPATPPCNSGGVLAWQYAEGCYSYSGNIGKFDEDIVTALGWYYLW